MCCLCLHLCAFIAKLFIFRLNVNLLVRNVCWFYVLLFLNISRPTSIVTLFISLYLVHFPSISSSLSLSICGQTSSCRIFWFRDLIQPSLSLSLSLSLPLSLSLFLSLFLSFLFFLFYLITDWALQQRKMHHCWIARFPIQQKARCLLHIDKSILYSKST